MTSRSIRTIDPAGVAERLAAVGEGIVVALAGTGIDGKHPHFARHANLVLPTPLQHYDLTLVDWHAWIEWRSLRAGGDALLTFLSNKFGEELLNNEALIGASAFTTHLGGVIAGHAEQNDPGIEWEASESVMRGIAPRCKLLILKVLDD